ncbi:sensor histidine kinase [Granulicella rosea]|uniref:sensor histidine kinase n=1 Tax=Granulicella rosea TaxID=474952 RepID=UPI001FEC624A|nr:sensor histidine kinase [Granulicella rosea]
MRLENSPVTFIPLPEVKDRGFETISGDSAGHLWVAAQKLFEIEDGNVRPFAKGFANLNVRTIYRAHDGALWVGTEGGGVRRIADGDSRSYTAPAQLTSNSIRSFMETRGGQMWIATEDGVSVVDETGVHRLAEASGLVYSSTRSLLEAHDGTIWIGTDRGLSAWKNGQFVSNTATQSLAKERVWSILQDHQGALWFGTREHGVYRMREGSIDHFTADEGLPTNSIYKILQDRQGMFWLSGPNVIFSVTEDEMDVRSSSRVALTPLVYVNPSEGVQMYGGVEPAGYLAPDDTVWFPSNRGIAQVKPTKSRPAAWAPGVMVFQIGDDGHAISLRHKTSIPAEMLRVSFRLSAVYLRPQESLRFRYKLDGFESKWTEGRPDTVATYTNLRPGTYHLIVQIIDLSLPGSITQDSFQLDKAPFFYQTRTFYLCCALFIVVVGWLLYRLRLRQMRLRFDAVLDERARLAREMHDTVIQGCTGISALLEAAEGCAESPRTESAELLNHARELTVDTINQARQAVWAMRHGPEADVDLIDAMHDLARQTMSEHKAIQVRTDAAGSMLLPASVAHEVIMVMRESVYNAIQHSGSTEVMLTIHARRESIVLDIVDFGCGLDADLDSCIDAGHYGILGMRERLKRIGGTLELVTAPGKGTTVRAIFKPIHSLKGAILV